MPGPARRPFVSRRDLQRMSNAHSQKWAATSDRPRARAAIAWRVRVRARAAGCANQNCFNPMARCHDTRNHRGNAMATSQTPTIGHQNGVSISGSVAYSQPPATNKSLRLVDRGRSLLTPSPAPNSKRRPRIAKAIAGLAPRHTRHVSHVPRASGRRAASVGGMRHSASRRMNTTLPSQSPHITIQPQATFRRRTHVTS